MLTACPHLGDVVRPGLILDHGQPTNNVACSSRRVQVVYNEGGFEGSENGPKQCIINNKLLSYRPTYNAGK